MLSKRQTPHKSIRSAPLYVRLRGLGLTNVFVLSLLPFPLGHSRQQCDFHGDPRGNPVTRPLVCRGSIVLCIIPVLLPSCCHASCMECQPSLYAQYSSNFRVLGAQEKTVFSQPSLMRSPTTPRYPKSLFRNFKGSTCYGYAKGQIN